MLDKFLPKHLIRSKPEYTKQQLNWCKENEGLIWSYIVKNEDLNTINPTTIQTYIGEAPSHKDFRSGTFSPGEYRSMDRLADRKKNSLTIIQTFGHRRRCDAHRTRKILEEAKVQAQIDSCRLLVSRCRSRPLG